MSNWRRIRRWHTCRNFFVGVIALIITARFNPAIAKSKVASDKSIPQGAIVYVAPLKGLDPEFGDTLTIFSLSTPSLVTKILRRPEPGDVRLSSVSADGKKIAFYWTSPETSFSSAHEYLHVLDLSKGTETTVFHGRRERTLWSPDGSILWVALLTDHDESLFLDLEKRRMWRWKPKPSAVSGSDRELSLSLDDAIFTAEGILGTQSVQIGSETEGFQRVTSFVLFHWQNPTRVIKGNADHGRRDYAIAPNLSLIADVDTIGHLGVRPFSGEKHTSIELADKFLRHPAWSPDSQWVALETVSPKATNLIAVNAISGRTVTLAKVAPPSDLGAIWVPSKPVAKSTIAAEIEAGLGPGEPLPLPMDCWREGLFYTADWSQYKPVGPCPWPLKKASLEESDE
jgi:hypothetical protein